MPKWRFMAESDLKILNYSHAPLGPSLADKGFSLYLSR